MKQVIVVTDGDRKAKETIELSGSKLGIHTISASWGNPTRTEPENIIEMVNKASTDPLLVMVDDKGNEGKGSGERVLEALANCPDIDILGVIAVASNTGNVRGVEVTFSVTSNGDIVSQPVDKEGQPEPEGQTRVEGDTVDCIEDLDIDLVIGLGDVGKMNYIDDPEFGAPITTKAIEMILEKSRCKT